MRLKTKQNADDSERIEYMTSKYPQIGYEIFLKMVKLYIIKFRKVFGRLNESKKGVSCCVIITDLSMSVCLLDQFPRSSEVYGIA